ncbi:unnamed protein product [Oikopleura dioica]|uniref:Uncharacterized protein n=1 Tax=Oikopleura dioica TaxID=34765 RepID=E4YQI1_OIKDI|nr:unnamed protein product [Oikopleura dioica]
MKEELDTFTRSVSNELFEQKEKQRQDAALKAYENELASLGRNGKMPLGMGNNDQEQLSEMMNQLTNYFF